MKRKIFLSGLIAAGVAYLFYWQYNARLIHTGMAAPDFTLSTQSGTVTLSQYSGKVVLLNFWASWCPPCRSEMPSLEAVKEHMEGKPFEMLAVSVDEGGWPAINRFLREQPLTMTIALDARSEVAERYGVSILPQTYLIDKKGMVVESYTGPRDWMAPSVIREVERYLQE